MSQRFLEKLEEMASRAQIVIHDNQFIVKTSKQGKRQNSKKYQDNSSDFFTLLFVLES